MRPHAALAVGLTGLAVTVIAAEVLGVVPAEGVLLMAISGGGALAAGVIGTLLLRLMPQARFLVQLTAVVAVGIVAVAAGALAAASKMLLPEEALGRFVVVVLTAGTVGALVSLTLSRRVTLAQESLAAAARRLGERGAPPAAAPPPIREFAAIAVELEATRRRLEESREREQRLDASRRELIAWLSHDLRTPLAGIRALTEALEDRVVHDPATVSRYHRRLSEQAERVADMVEDLFALSRIHAGAAEVDRPRVSLSDLVSDAVATLEAVALQQGVLLDGRCEEPIDVHASPTELSRVLENLLCNAIRETPAGGRVDITARARDEHAVVVVTDECGGMPPDVLARVFDAGYRATTARTPDSSARGGFGLTIARGLAEAHGGTLTARNVGAGCEFTLTLPRAARAAEAEAGQPSSAAIASSSGSVPISPAQRATTSPSPSTSTKNG